MRVLFTVILFLVLCLPEAKAQKLRYGIVAGLNVAHVSGYDFYAVNPQGYTVCGYGRAGLQVGGLAYYPIGNLAELSLDLKYTQKGDRKKSYLNMNDSILWGIRLSYVESNLILKVRVIKMLGVYGGLGYGVLVKNQTEALRGKLPDTFNELPYSRGDISFSWGMSARIVRGLNLNLGLQISMASVVKGQVGNITYSSHYGDIGIYNEVVNITLDYRFGSRKIYSDQSSRNVRYL